MQIASQMVSVTIRNQVETIGTLIWEHAIDAIN